MPDPWQRVLGGLAVGGGQGVARMLRQFGTVKEGPGDPSEDGALVIGLWCAGAPLRALELYRRQEGANTAGEIAVVTAALAAESVSNVISRVKAVISADETAVEAVAHRVAESEKILHLNEGRARIPEEFR